MKLILYKLSGISLLSIGGLACLMVLVGGHTAKAAPKYEWVQIDRLTYPEITGKNNSCGAWRNDSYDCDRNREGTVVRMYNPGEVGDRIGQGWNESFNATRSRINFQRYDNCTHAGGASAGPGRRVYECKNVGDPEPSPVPPPDYQWVLVGAAPRFMPDMRGKYTGIRFETCGCCPSSQTLDITCDASIAGKGIVAEYKATAYVTLADRGSYFQGTAASLLSPTVLRATGFNRGTCGVKSYTQWLGVGYQSWRAYQCVAATPPAPPTWSITSITATPPSGEVGVAPLNVDITATGSGTATGSILWEFDCDENSAYEGQYVASPDNPKTHACTYVSPPGDGVYTISVRSTRLGQSATRTVDVPVSVTPVSATLNVSDSTVEYLDPVLITWDSTNALTCTGSGAGPQAQGWRNHVAGRLSGQYFTDPLTETQSFGLSCENVGPSIELSRQVVVQDPPPPVVQSFSVDSIDAVACGDNSSGALLRWTSTAEPQAGFHIQVSSDPGFSAGSMIVDEIHVSNNPVVVSFVPTDETSSRWEAVLSWLKDNLFSVPVALARSWAQNDSSCANGDGDCTPEGNSGIDCFRDADCFDNSCGSYTGWCINRQCACGNRPPFCGDRCANLPVCPYGTSTCGGHTVSRPWGSSTVHVTDCRGIRNGDRGGVISYCTQSAPIPPPPPPPQEPRITINASPLNPQWGHTFGTTISWSVIRATSCTASGPSGPGTGASFSGGKPLGGSHVTGSLTPDGAFPVALTYTLRCTGPGGTRSGSVNVNVQPPPTPAVSVTHNAPVAGVPYRGFTTINWDASGFIDSCVRTRGETGGSWPTTYSAPLPVPRPSYNTLRLIDDPTFYTVTCTGRGGTNSANAQVNVGPPPTPTIIEDRTPVAGLPFDETLYARIKVYRDIDPSTPFDPRAPEDVPSDAWYYLDGGSFVTESAPPAPNASASPSRPRVGQEASFTDTGTCPSGTCTRTWDFGDGGTGSGSPTAHTYTESATGLTIRLRSEESSARGLGCEDTIDSLDVSKAIPIFKEVAPQ